MTAKRKRSTTTTIDAPVQVMTPPPVNGHAPAPVETVTPQPANTAAPAPSGEATKDGAAPVRVPRAHHYQAVEQLNLLLRYQEMRTGLASADDAFHALMPAYGLTPAFLAAGEALYFTAEDAIAQRHVATVAAIEATAVQSAAYRLARAEYMGFRKVGRTVVTDAPGRVALFLEEAVSNRIDVFAQAAESALVAAQAEPYASLLAAVTLAPARIAEMLAAVRALAAAIAERQIAAHRVTIATKARNAAVDELRVFVQRLAVEVDTMVRANPHLRTPTGF